jgi:phenylpropionate dioxygenase-like ring-hydroxylating dioxygenase large terminal subunit
MSKQPSALIASLPAPVYTDPGIFQLEQDKIFGASWQFACPYHARTTFAEDQEVINSGQQGLGSRGYQAGPLMVDAENSRYSEHAVASIQQYWRDAMGDEYGI